MSLFVISEQVGLDGYWITDILSGVKKEADKKNLHIETFPLDFTAYGESSPVVLVVGYSPEWITSACRRAVRCGARPVAVNVPFSVCGDVAAASVSFDYQKAIKTALSYLSGCKKRRIAFLGSRENRLSFDCKKAAFEEQTGAFSEGFARVFEGASIAETVASFLPFSNGFDAVICSRDAEGGYLSAQLQKKRLSVPFIISFGDSEMAQYFTPSLTALRTDFSALGEEAVRLSRFVSNGGCDGFVSSMVECPLIVRDSTDGKICASDLSEPFLPTPSYHSDPEYISYLRAEELVRSWDALDRSIVECLLEGHNTVEIAERLFISPSSVKYRIKKMLTAADLEGRAKLVALVKRYGIL